jgi:two-component system phosphate regulon sensor histidine kinase PhoR
MTVMSVTLISQLATMHARALERQFVAQVSASATQPQLIDAWQDDGATLNALIQEWSNLLGARVTLFSADQQILADSHDRAETEADGIPLPEVRAAKETGFGRSVRVDPATGREVAFLAFPVQDDGEIIGTIRWAYPLTGVQRGQAQIQRAILVAALVTALLLLGLLSFHYERSARTVRQLTSAAKRIAIGDLDARVESFGGGEVGRMARTFNRMAAELQRQIRKRGREQDRLTTMLQIMADGVIMVSRKGKVRLINPAAAQILDTTETDALKRSFVQTVRDHRVAEVWQRCRESGSQEVDTVEMGEQRFLRVVVTPYLLGEARGYLIMLQDLSRMRQLQTVRQDFVSNVSHELRTPLAALRALVDTLRDGALDDPPMAQHFLDLMEGEVDSLTQMVQELLELSRIESGQVPFEFKSVSATKLLQEAIARLKPQSERAGVRLTMALPDDLPDVWADAQRVQQVVMNLIHNAIKFTPASGSVDLSAEWVDDYVIVVVKDTGVGIPVADLSRIFERFYKSDRSRSGGGTGLGLAIAKHVIQAHGGEIWAESIEGQGSIFYFTLPIAGEGSVNDMPTPNVVAQTNGTGQRLDQTLPYHS